MLLWIVKKHQTDKVLQLSFNCSEKEVVASIEHFVNVPLAGISLLLKGNAALRLVI